MFRVIKTSTHILKLSKNILTYKQIRNISLKCDKKFKILRVKNYQIHLVRALSEKAIPDLPNDSYDKESNNSSDFQDQNYINVSEITDGDPTLEKKLRVLMLEAEVYRQEGQKAPSAEFTKEHHWKELLSLPSKSARKKYLAFLWKVEKIRANSKLKKINASKNIERIKEEQQSDDGHIKYGLSGNTIYIRIYDSTINQLANNKLVQAMQFGQRLVVDCSYDSYMTKQEKTNAAKQLMLLFAENRAHDDPFDLHFCNADMNGKVMDSLYRHIPTLKEPWFPLNIHEKSYLDLFPKEKLVYLTPHCRQDLNEFDHDAIYIIGAMVDKANSEPLSLAKAKKEGLRMARLPLDRYLQWNSGSGKSLTINQMTSILLDIKSTGDWSRALRHVPRRKISEPGEYVNEDNFNMRFDRSRKNHDRSSKPKIYAEQFETNGGDTNDHFKNNRKLHRRKDSRRVRIEEIME